MSIDPAITDLRRELGKAREVLEAAQKHLARHAEANAALHCATAVMYSPLHTRVTAAIAGVTAALSKPTLSTENDRLANVLLDLDRCMHGRHGESIVVPERKFRHSAEAWRTTTPTATDAGIRAIPEA